MSARVIIELNQNGNEVCVSSISLEISAATKHEEYAAGFFTHLINEQLKRLKKWPHHCDEHGVVQRLLKPEEL